MRGRAPRAPLFPYPTLFRSKGEWTTLLGVGGLGKSRLALWRCICQMVKRLLPNPPTRSEEHTSELQSHSDLVCRLLLEKKNCWTLKTRPPLINNKNNTKPNR